MSSTRDLSQNHNPLSHFINSISSYDSNIMLAAVISLLLVILFVLLLHIYAKWFLAHARHRRRPSSVSVSHVWRSAGFHHFHTFSFDATNLNSPSKGLDASVISSIPLFVYNEEEHKKRGSECVICLSAFEENEVGRRLAKCGHGFHVECIDMWLHSHSSCPICRAPVAGDNADEEVKSTEVSGESTGVVMNEVGLSDRESILDIAIDVSSSENETGNLVGTGGSLPESSSSSSLGSSLKRILSRNRSDRKVFPSSTGTQMEA